MDLHAAPDLSSRSSMSKVRDIIERCVRTRTCGTIRDLRVEVLDEGVVISGRATTYYTKQLATHAALEAAENVNLTNDIEVC